MATNHSPTHHGHGRAPDNDGPVLVPPQSTAISDQNPAADFIRQKLASIYSDEPDAAQETAEAQLPGMHHSRHQQYMLQLNNSGKSASEIQTAWHQYYLGLSDLEKRQVWQEFYDQSAQAKQQASRLQPNYQYTPDTPQITQERPEQQPTQQQPLNAAHNPLLGGTPSVSHSPQDTAYLPADQEAQPPAASERQPDIIRRQLRDKISKRSKKPAGIKHHVQSLLFGLGFGGLVLLVTLFGFFNEVVIAPFIQPSRNVSATPIIISPDGITASDKNEVIIPKINVEIPLDFSATSTDEKEFEAALDKGVAHYPTTALPGQKGNTSFFGHSSNNIFNPGKYKFAFVLLNELVPGDTFYITYNGTAYAYTVYDKKIVEATQVDILNPVTGKDATAMLVTCDPPGTSLRRLAVWGEQIRPSPSSNTASTAQTTHTASPGNGKDSSLPGNGPTLWGRIRDWITGS